MKLYNFTLKYNQGGLEVDRGGFDVSSATQVEDAVKRCLKTHPLVGHEYGEGEEPAPYFEFNDTEEKAGEIFVDESNVSDAGKIGTFTLREIEKD